MLTETTKLQQSARNGVKLNQYNGQVTRVLYTAAVS